MTVKVVPFFIAYKGDTNMLTTLKIGEKEVNVRTSALTSIIFRNLFRKDLTTEISALKTGENVNLDIFKELAFVMAWQATPSDSKVNDMKNLSNEDYLMWLDQFDEIDFYDPELLSQITTTWLSSQKSVIDVKNLVSPQ